MIAFDIVINFLNLSLTYTKHFATNNYFIISVILLRLYTSTKTNKKNQ